MRCVIVGAAGFIGRRFGTALCDRGHDVLGLDASVPAPALPFPCERHDVAHDAPALPPDVDAVWYLAQSPAYRSFPEGAGDLFAVNAGGAIRCAEAAAAAGVRVFGYASTGTVYAPGFEPMDETRPVRRDQGYALSKLAAEDALALLDDAADSMSVICPRLFGVYGPGQRGMMVPAIIDRVRSGRPVTIERHPCDDADVDGLRISLTFVDDVVDGMLALTMARLDGAAVPRVINLAASRAVSIRELAGAVGEAVGRAPVLEICDRARPSDYVADTSLLREIVPCHDTPVDEAIRTTVEADGHG